MIEGTVSLGAGRGDELGDQPGHGQRHVGVPRRGYRDAHVLVVQVDAEPRLELAGEHGFPLEVEDAAAGEPAGQHVEPGPRVHARAFHQHDGLGHQRVGAADYQLVGGLDDLPGTVRADQGERRADRLEHAPRRLEGGGLPARHDGQPALDRASFAAADRRVEHLDADLGPGPCELTRGLRPDRGEVDIQDASSTRGFQGLEYPERAQCYLLHLRPVRQHGDDHLGVCHRVGDRGRRLAAGRGEPVHRGLLVIMPGHLVAGPDQVRGHRAAHDAQADETDARHACHLQPKLVELSAGSDGLYSQPIQPA